MVPAEPRAVLVVGTSTPIVSATMSILAELGRSAVLIDPATRSDEIAADAVAIVVGLDVSADADAWAQARHQLAPAAGMVAVLENMDPGTVSAALGAGARAVLVTPLSVEAIRRAVADVEEWALRVGGGVAGQPPPTPGRSTVVVGSRGGVGVTTIVTQLALRWLPDRVTAVDLERLAPAVSDQLGVTPRRDLFELAGVVASLSTRQLQDAGTAHPSGLTVYASSQTDPSELPGPEPVGPSSVRRLLERLADGADRVMIDGGRGLSTEATVAVGTADEVLVVVTPDVVSLRGAQRLLARWEAQGTRRPDQCRVLVNRSDRRDEIQRPTITRVLPATPMRTVIPADYRRLETLANGSTGTVRGRIGRAFDQLGAELGQSSIELVAVIALVIASLLALGQVLGLGLATSEVQRAASQGARASLLAISEPTADRGSVTAAAVRAATREAGDADSTVEVSMTARSVTVVVRRPAPAVLPGLGASSVVASVTVRRP